MSAPKITCGSFTVDRQFAAPPSRVFQAWSRAEELKIWAAPAPGWGFDIRHFDFRIGGTAQVHFGPPGDAPYVDSTRYDDIIPDRRIVTAYAITKGEVRISSSISCLEFSADGAGTRLRITETGVFLDGQDSAEGRKGGVAQQMEQLALFIAAA